MSFTKVKIFRDSVHGYIEIPQTYCELLIDTGIFQRLRQIEQTSMRCLYPSAHHDRFIHSLGVYHLGSIACNAIYKNSSSLIRNKSQWNSFVETFLIACLLHDCGHAPFSHTFEHYYDLEYSCDNDGRRRKLTDLKLIEVANDIAFLRDYEDCSPGPHEKASAILVLTKFADPIRRLGGDPLLAARMIVGCTFSNSDDDTSLLKNCLIRLLNNTSIDMDKLDYIVRDTWASGVNNTSIDSARLLSSLMIHKNEDGYPVLCFKKTALSVIESVIQGRNYLYQWIYTHHKVLYEGYILVKALKSLSGIILNHEDDSFLTQIVSLNCLHEQVSIGGYKFFLPVDGDLIHLLKEHQDMIPEAKEWLTRKHLNKSLWKNFPEFDLFFDNITAVNRDVIRGRAQEVLVTFLQRHGIDGTVVVHDAKVKFAHINHNEIFILINSKLYSFTKFYPASPDIHPKFFYVYIPENAMQYRNDIRNRLRRIAPN